MSKRKISGIESIYIDKDVNDTGFSFVETDAGIYLGSVRFPVFKFCLNKINKNKILQKLHVIYMSKAHKKSKNGIQI